MSDNPEFDKALRKSLGEGVDFLNCPIHNISYSLCPKCGEAICKECLE